MSRPAGPGGRNRDRSRLSARRRSGGLDRRLPRSSQAGRRSGGRWPFPGARSRGGFNRSSQHSIERSCDGQEEAGFGSGDQTADAFAGAADGRAQGASRAVLECNRLWRLERGGGGGGRRVGGRWRPVVSGGWRDAVGQGFRGSAPDWSSNCQASPAGSSALFEGMGDRRRLGRLTRAGESGNGLVVGGGHGALRVGRRFADCVAAWEEAPVIHPVARGGPGCRAVLGGSIKRAAVLARLRVEARHRSELARACTSRPGRERKSGVSWRWSCGLGQLLVVVVVDVGLACEAADLAVAQPVVAEGEDLAGDGDLGDVAAAALGDPLKLRA